MHRDAALPAFKPYCSLSPPCTLLRPPSISIEAFMASMWSAVQLRSWLRWPQEPLHRMSSTMQAPQCSGSETRKPSGGLYTVYRFLRVTGQFTVSCVSLGASPKGEEERNYFFAYVIVCSCCCCSLVLAPDEGLLMQTLSFVGAVRCRNVPPFRTVLIDCLIVSVTGDGACPAHLCASLGFG